MDKTFGWSCSILLYDAFAKDGQSTEESKKCEKAKQALVDSFGTTDRPEDKVTRALEGSLDQQKMFDLLNNINQLYKWEKLV